MSAVLPMARQEMQALRSLLSEVLAMMKESVADADGADRVDLSCGNCVAGTPTPHSLGCRVGSAIFRLDAALAEEGKS